MNTKRAEEDPILQGVPQGASQYTPAGWDKLIARKGATPTKSAAGMPGAINRRTAFALPTTPTMPTLPPGLPTTPTMGAGPASAPGKIKPLPALPQPGQTKFALDLHELQAILAGRGRGRTFRPVTLPPPVPPRARAQFTAITPDMVTRLGARPGARPVVPPVVPEIEVTPPVAPHLLPTAETRNLFQRYPTRMSLGSAAAAGTVVGVGAYAKSRSGEHGKPATPSKGQGATPSKGAPAPAVAPVAAFGVGPGMAVADAIAKAPKKQPGSFDNWKDYVPGAVIAGVGTGALALAIDKLREKSKRRDEDDYEKQSRAWVRDYPSLAKLAAASLPAKPLISAPLPPKASAPAAAASPAPAPKPIEAYAGDPAQRPAGTYHIDRRSGANYPLPVDARPLSAYESKETARGLAGGMGGVASALHGRYESPYDATQALDPAHGNPDGWRRPDPWTAGRDGAASDQAESDAAAGAQADKDDAGRAAGYMANRQAVNMGVSTGVGALPSSVRSHLPQGDPTSTVSAPVNPAIPATPAAPAAPKGGPAAAAVPRKRMSLAARQAYEAETRNMYRYPAQADGRASASEALTAVQLDRLIYGPGKYEQADIASRAAARARYPGLAQGPGSPGVPQGAMNMGNAAIRSGNARAAAAAAAAGENSPGGAAAPLAARPLVRQVVRQVGPGQGNGRVAGSAWPPVKAKAATPPPTGLASAPAKAATPPAAGAAKPLASATTAPRPVDADKVVQAVTPDPGGVMTDPNYLPGPENGGKEKEIEPEGSWLGNNWKNLALGGAAGLGGYGLYRAMQGDDDDDDDDRRRKHSHAKRAATMLHRELSEDEDNQIADSASRPFSDLIWGAGTPLARTMSSPGAGAAIHGGVGAALGGVAGAGIGSLAGSPEAGAAVGAGLGAIAGGTHGYLARSQWNQNTADLMRRLPQGATYRDYQADKGDGYDRDQVQNIRAMRYIARDLANAPHRDKVAGMFDDTDLASLDPTAAKPKSPTNVKTYGGRKVRMQNGAITQTNGRFANTQKMAASTDPVDVQVMLLKRAYASV